jgi:hypothetical protein
MAIDIIPGVGPQNSDIAATIATTPAVSAQITANVPTASAIATAVAAPSLAQITTAITTNAAPASVTMAAITSSITTNAASAGVTMAAIGTSVANNSPSANNWTLIGSIALTSGTTQTFSSLSGYKTYRLMVHRVSTNNTSISILLRINGDATAGNYQNNYSTNSGTVSNTSLFWLTTSTTGFNNFGAGGSLDISNANVAAPKRIGNGFAAANSGAFTSTGSIEGIWGGTAAVNSISITADSSSTFTQGTLYLLGAN